MTPPATPVRLEALLQHSEWLRDLARRLVRDADQADELAQRTWVAALERPPLELSSARQWLATVLRNLVRQERRADTRRSWRERLVSRPEAEPSTLDVLARASLQRRITDAVLELDEPYRTTILLRFFDGLPPREVARAQGVPVDTVRTRTSRALGMLRERLDGEYGARGAWSAMVFAWIRPETSVAAPLGAAVLMNLKVKLALVVLPLIAALAVWIGTRDSSASGEPAPTARVEGAGPAPVAPGGAVAGTPVEERRDVAPAASPSGTAPAAGAVAELSPRVQRGRVVDELERPIADVRVVVAGCELAALTGADGRFELAAAAGRLVVEDERWTTLFAGVGRETESIGETTLVVAPRVRFGGRVTDVEGLPLGGARVTIELPEAFRTRLASVLDRSERMSWKTESAADGTYHFDDAPGIAGAELSGALDGYLTHREELVGVAQGDVWITLAAPGLDPSVLRGRVVDARGRPVEDARVAFGIDTTKSDEDGFFAFQRDDPRAFGKRMGIAPTWMSAVKRGYLPARFEPELSGSEPQWPGFVVLRLGETPLEIRGRVVDAEREPLAGVRVWVANTTFLGAVDGQPTTIENLLAGDPAFWHFVTSDERGEFVIDGLLDQEYELGALAEENLLRAEPERVAAGTSGVELVLPTDQLYPRVAGRLVSRSGAAVAGARIALMCDAFQSRFRGDVVGTSHASAMASTSDEQGRFEFRGVPRSLVYLRIDGDGILPLEYGRYVEGDPRFANVEVKELPRDRIESLEITVALRCHVRVELADPELADEFAVLDERGVALELSVFEGSGRAEGPRAPILAGRSNTTAVPDHGVTLVLYRSGVEVARRPIELAPGEVQTLGF